MYFQICYISKNILYTYIKIYIFKKRFIWDFENNAVNFYRILRNKQHKMLFKKSAQEICIITVGILFVILSLLFNSMLVHGYTPDATLLKSTIISIPKDSAASTCDTCTCDTCGCLTLDQGIRSHGVDTS